MNNTKNNVIVLIGESGSGKSTIASMLAKKYNYQKIISYTTRPSRDYEVDGIDYHFITEEKFKELKKHNFFAEIGEYRNWFYGSAVIDYKKDKMIAVLTPKGLRQIKRNEDLDIISFYINIPRKDRLIKILQRDTNVDECYRRNLMDCGMFDGVADEVDFVIDNEGYRKTSEEIADEIMMYLKGIDK